MRFTVWVRSAISSTRLPLKPFLANSSVATASMFARAAAASRTATFFSAPAFEPPRDLVGSARSLDAIVFPFARCCFEIPRHRIAQEAREGTGGIRRSWPNPEESAQLFAGNALKVFEHALAVRLLARKDFKSRRRLEYGHAAAVERAAPQGSGGAQQLGF